MRRLSQVIEHRAGKHARSCDLFQQAPSTARQRTPPRRRPAWQIFTPLPRHPGPPTTVLRVLFFQAAQPRGQRAAPDPHPAARQPHHRRPGSLPAPAAESRPGHPQLGDHLIDPQQRVIRGTGRSARGGGGPAGSGARSRGRPVRGSATTDAPLRPPRQVRPPPSRPRRTAAWGCGETGKEAKPRGRRHAAWRAAWSCRRGRPAGPGAGSRTVADGTLPSAAGPRDGLASRPGPQASTRTSPRQVKSPPPSTGTGLTPGPEPRVDAARCPPRMNKGTALGPANHRPGTAKGARWRVPARHAPPSHQRPVPAGSLMRACLPAASTPRCQKDLSWAGWPRVPPLCPLLQKSGFQGLFSRAAGKPAPAR